MSAWLKTLLWLPCLLLAPGHLGAEAAVVVNIANSVEDISKQQLANIYLGKTAAWENQQSVIYPVALTFNNPLSRLFFERGLGKKKAELQKAWLKLALSGAAKPPKIANTERDILDYVAKHRGALGFISCDALVPDAPPEVRVIRVEGKLPREEGYLFD